MDAALRVFGFSDLFGHRQPTLVDGAGASQGVFCRQELDLWGQNHTVWLCAQAQELANNAYMRGTGVDVKMRLGIDDIGRLHIVHLHRDLQWCKQ